MLLGLQPFKDHSQFQEMTNVNHPSLFSGQIRLDISRELSASLVFKKETFFLSKIWSAANIKMNLNTYFVHDFHNIISNSYTMGCLPVCGDNPRTLANGLSYIQVDNHGITILYHLHQCRPCTSRDILYLNW